MIMMTAATRQEIDGINRHLGGRRQISNHGCTAWRGVYKKKEVLAVQTGIGRAIVERVINPILTSHQVNALISLGFGGALTTELSVGDLVVCASILRGETGSVPVNSYRTDEYLLRCALEAVDGNRLKWRCGNGVTVPELASNAETKRLLRNGSGADVCEMEDYWVAEAASTRRIPFLAVRVIYDEVNATLLDYGKIVDQEGNVRLWGAMTYLLGHPRQILNALSSYNNCRRAQESLAAFVDMFLDVV